MNGSNDSAMQELADLVAMDDSAHISALHPHRTIAAHLWAALRTLGFESGLVLAHGDDPATFLGHPQAKGHGFGSLTATVDPGHQPGYELRLKKLTEVQWDFFDVVITALPYNDVKLSHPVHQARHRVVQDMLTLASLDLTKPGGLTVILASHDFLDAVDSPARHEAARHGDLLGAVRLPGGIQRNLAGTDNPTDLLLMQRIAPGHAPRGPQYTDVTSIIVDGRRLALNTYFDTRPDHVLGQIGVDPLADGPNALTVTAAHPHRFALDLGSALRDIATEALDAGLVFAAEAASVDPAPPPPTSEQTARAECTSRTKSPRHRDLDPEVDLGESNLEDPGLGLW